MEVEVPVGAGVHSCVNVKMSMCGVNDDIVRHTLSIGVPTHSLALACNNFNSHFRCVND